MWSDRISRHQDKSGRSTAVFCHRAMLVQHKALRFCSPYCSRNSITSQTQEKTNVANCECLPCGIVWSKLQAPVEHRHRFLQVPLPEDHRRLSTTKIRTNVKWRLTKEDIIKVSKRVAYHGDFFFNFKNVAIFGLHFDHLLGSGGFSYCLCLQLNLGIGGGRHVWREEIYSGSSSVSVYEHRWGRNSHILQMYPPFSTVFS